MTHHVIAHFYLAYYAFHDLQYVTKKSSCKNVVNQ